jgi:hypothetical protein
MIEAVGPRCGPFLELRDDSGLLHKVRASSILALSEVEPNGDLTSVLLPGGRSFLVNRPINEIAAWFR